MTQAIIFARVNKSVDCTMCSATQDEGAEKRIFSLYIKHLAESV